MPTPTGLPKVGEVWERDVRVRDFPRNPMKVVILERTRGDYWGLRVYTQRGEYTHWVDAPYWLSQGWFKYIGPAGPETKKRLGLP